MGADDGLETTEGAALYQVHQESPLASVVIVTFNSAKWMRECLTALRAQDFNSPFEIIVVDNGSTDETAAIVQEQFPEVRFIPFENRGFGAGNNLGAHHARGTYLAFINPDTVASPSWLREIVGPLTEKGKVTTSKILLLQDPHRINTCGNQLHFTGYGFTNGFDEEANRFSVDAEVPGISGAAFGMRREDFLTVGGFDEDFFLYMEDTELSWRLRRFGFSVVLCSRSIVRHSYSLHVSPSKIYHLEKGRMILLRKHYCWHHWVKYLPALTVAEALAWGWALGHGAAGIRAKRRGMWEGLQRPIHRGRLPPLRLSSFANWRLPFESLALSRGARVLGHAVNGLLWMNTLAWRWNRRGLMGEKTHGERA